MSFAPELNYSALRTFFCAILFSSCTAQRWWGSANACGRAAACDSLAQTGLHARLSIRAYLCSGNEQWCNEAPGHGCCSTLGSPLSVSPAWSAVPAPASYLSAECYAYSAKLAFAMVYMHLYRAPVQIWGGGLHHTRSKGRARAHVHAWPVWIHSLRVYLCFINTYVPISMCKMVYLSGRR